MMAHSITVQTQEDFEELMQANNFEISSAIVKTILKNLKGRKKHVHILEINVLEEQTIYDITINREDMLESLEKNLKIHEENEAYEVCSEIVKAIEYLKSK
jgi:saccharopine dehydrogenase-like NADP-dependent oxidoreductase